MPHVLIVDDEQSVRDFLTILFEREGYQVTLAAEAEAALAAVAGATDFDAVITDVRMPGMSGLELLAELKHRSPDLPVIMVTAFASPDDAVQAMRNGAFDYLTKPFNVDELRKVVKTAVAKRKKGTSAETGDGFAGIIGSSSEMLQIFDLIRRVAPTPASVLIYGESGTGKELIAKAIHDFSKAAKKPFVPINCSAIPESLMESELFGHAKGAFTGAVADKTGLFEQAHTGTLFLDEIGELNLSIQTKLLRVLQEREIMPIGSTRTKHVDVRIVSATNRNLEEEVMEKRFREDLFYRLSVVPLRMPPLRERKGDVPLLVDYFLRKYAKLMGKEVQTISSYGLEVLMNYNFPGNVRELENIIERGVALESSSIILPESLILSRKEQKNGADRSATVKEPLFIGAQDEDELFDRGLEESIARMEKKMIMHALDAAEGSKIRAAELLKISFRSLRYKAKKYEID